MPKLPSNVENLPAASAFNRRVLDVLVIMSVIAQAFLVFMLMAGSYGAEAAPVAGGATVAMSLMAYFYARWLVPVLDRRHILAVLLLKEVAVIVFVGLAAGLVWLLHLIIEALG